MFIDHPPSTSSLKPIFPLLCDSFASLHQTFVLETSLLETICHSRDRRHPRFRSVPCPLTRATLLMIRFIRVIRGLKAASCAVPNPAKTSSHCFRKHAQNRKIGPNRRFDTNRMIPATCSRVWKSIVKSMARVCVCPILLKTLESHWPFNELRPFQEYDGSYS